MTPINPTFARRKARIASLYDNIAAFKNSANRFREAGYDVIESIGPLEENNIGSNCGQFVTALKQGQPAIVEAYTYEPVII